MALALLMVVLLVATLWVAALWRGGPVLARGLAPRHRVRPRRQPFYLEEKGDHLMVPADFVTYFSVLAGVGATLFGLIFVTISITPETTRTETTSVMQQVQVASAYTALLNPLVISLFALVPHATIGTVTVIMSAIGLVNTGMMGISLLRDARNWAKKLRSAFFLFGSLVIYGIEFFFALRLAGAPTDRAALYDLTTLLVIIYIFGVARAWDLVGARPFHLHNLVTPLMPKRLEDILSEPSPTEHASDESGTKD